MQEGLATLLQQISDMKLYPDADVPWLIQLETQIIEKGRAAFTAQQPVVPPGPVGAFPGQGGAPPQGPGAPAAAPALAAAISGGMGGGPPQPGPRGLAVRQPPNPDEVRRLLTMGRPRGAPE